MSRLRTGLTGTQNQKLRPVLDLFQCHKSNGGLGFFKQATVENLVFRGNYYYIHLRAISFFILFRLNSEIQKYPRTRFEE